MTTNRRRRRSWITSCHGSCWCHGMQRSRLEGGLTTKSAARSFSRPSSFLDPFGGTGAGVVRQSRSCFLCFSKDVDGHFVKPGTAVRSAHDGFRAWAFFKHEFDVV